MTRSGHGQRRARDGAVELACGADRLWREREPTQLYCGRASQKGQVIDEIAAKSHPDYFGAADDARDQTFDQDRRRGTDLENKRLDRPNIG